MFFLGIIVIGLIVFAIFKMWETNEEHEKKR